MPETTLPPIGRVSFADNAQKAASELVADPDRVGQVAAEASRLLPLHRMQVAFDQLVGHAETRRAGGLGPYGHDYAGYVQAELDGANRHAEVLMVAATAAQAMMQEMTSQLQDLEVAMAKAKDDKDPQLTPDGSPHPLQAGGYDPATDSALPSNISDIEALKEGKTTRAQNEAIAKADAAGDEGAEPTPSDMPPADVGIATPTALPKGSTAHKPAGTRGPTDDDTSRRGHKGK
jgi:hypothetical protein